MLIDSHCHLPEKKYDKPLDQVIQDAMSAGVTGFINIGTSLEENIATLSVSSKYTNIFSALAIYPHANQVLTLTEIEQKLSAQVKSSSKVVAVGECGIDLAGGEGERRLDKQVELLEMQLQIAVDNKLPVVIHNRGGDDFIFGIFDKFMSRGLVGVAHCFSQSQKIAEQYLERGFYLSFSGMLTYPSRSDLREIAKITPKDRILVETDAPYLPPQGFRGQINEPKYVIEVAKKLAEVTGESFDKVSEITYSNTCRLFGLKKEYV